MQRLSAIALATAALAGAAPEAYAQVLNWPAKRDEAAAANPNAQPLIMGVPRESRYSPRRSAPVSTRSMPATVVRAPVQQPTGSVVAETRRTTRSVPVLPAPAVTARAETPAPQPLARAYTPPVQAAAEPVRRIERAQPAPAQTFASLTKPLPAAAAPVDWTVREELMKQVPPTPAKAQAPAKAKAEAAAPVATAKTEAKSAPAKAETKVAAVPAAPAKATAKATAPAEAPPAAKTAAAAPLEPWRTRTGQDGPRLYSLHRQFGMTPDQARAAQLKGAAADPLPNAFFLSAAEEVVEEDEAEAEQRGRDAEKARQASQKKKNRRK